MDIEVRPLAESDLPAADRVFRDAFGKVLGADLPADVDLLGTRLRAPHTAAVAAFSGGDLVGSNVMTSWGSVACFGPLSVTPKLWSYGIGARLVAAAVDVLDEWGATHQGLFTFAQSPHHHRLYERFGFWPRFLTAIMSRPVAGTEPALGWRLTTTAQPDRAALIARAYVKFAAVRPGPGLPGAFDALVAACLGYAAEVGATRLTLGVNTARHEAYRQLLAAGFRTDIPGVTMHRPNEPGYDREDVRVLDDWR